MNKLKKVFGISVIAVLMVVALTGCTRVQQSSDGNLSGSIKYVRENFGAGLDVRQASNNDTALNVYQSGTANIFNVYDGTTNVLSVADGGAVSLASSLTVAGATTLSTLTQGGGVTATSTGGNSAFLGTEFDTENIVNITPSTAVSKAFPASSTVNTFLSTTAGSMRQVLFTNESSTAGRNVTLTAGTGETIYNASGTAAVGSPILTPGARAILTFIRKTNSDITILLHLFK